jgi:pyruvate ferredoxin oxidoreductase gamma subunit
MLRQLRFHGRGGEGVKVASRIVTRAGFLAGLTAQDSPLYGAERRGAPVVASARLADEALLERGYVAEPDVIAVMDASLLGEPQAAVLDGVAPSTAVLVNSARPAEELKAAHGVPGPLLCVDVSAIALAQLQHHLLGAPMAGFALKAIGLVAWDLVAAAVRIELGALGVSSSLVARNLNATRQVFEEAPQLKLAARPPLPAAPPSPLFVVPRRPAAEASPSIDAGATSELRRTAGWRVDRPVIDLGHCNRCFLCFALCPEGAIHLDAQHYPLVDYDHCKGCLVCVSECPTHTIRAEREVAA